jgi:uncharacterized protein YkwD
VALVVGASVAGLVSGCGASHGKHAKKGSGATAMVTTGASTRTQEFTYFDGRLTTAAPSTSVAPGVTGTLGTTGADATTTGTTGTTTATTTQGTSSTTGVGSRFWYQNDAFGNPLEVHDPQEAALALQLFDGINAERAKQGLSPLVEDTSASQAAKAHSEDMVGRQFFDHITPEGWTPDDRLKMLNAGTYLAGGENIIQGSNDAAALIASWMASPPHRANILNPSFNRLGVGVKLVGSAAVATSVFLTR